MPVGSEGRVEPSISKSPIAQQDSLVTPRMWPRGETAVMPVLPDFKVASDEGALCVGTNAAFGTGVTGPNANAYSVQSAVFSIDTRVVQSVFPSYIRLITTGVPAGATAIEFAITGDLFTDFAAPSGGTVVTLNNTNRSGLPPTLNVRYVPTLQPATSEAVNLARAKGKQGAPLVGDEFLLLFGTVEMGAGLVMSTASPGRYIVPLPALVLNGDRTTALVHMWAPGSNAAGAFEFEVAVLIR